MRGITMNENEEKQLFKDPPEKDHSTQLDDWI